MTTQFEGYSIKERIGEGGFGDVYRAVQTLLDRSVALKTLRAELASEPHCVDDFHAQARLAARLEHPNIVRVYDCGRQHGISYVAMEYINGQTLDEIHLKRGAFAPSEAISIAMQVADALDYAHIHGVVHADLNPGNIMIAAGMVHVSDFRGSCRSAAGRRVVGVPEYVSPEQARGGEAVPASDVYSLGVIVYHMLSGRPPFSESEPLDTLNQHISSRVPPLRGPVHKIPDKLGRLVLCLLAKSPDERPTATSVRDELAAMSSSASPLRSRKLKRVRQPLSRGKKIAAAMIVPVGAAFWLVGALIFRSLSAERAIDVFAATRASSLARERAGEERAKRLEAEYTKEFASGQRLYNQRQFGLAEEAFKRASHLKPESTDPRMFLAAVYIEREQYGKAQWHLKRIIQLDPRNREARNALSFVQSRMEALPVELTGR